jgi:dTDP-glucose pyrophosphorylase
VSSKPPVKALVLARGKGTRMQRADQAATLDAAQSRVADAGLKAMIPFRRPFLDYILSALADAGCVDICLVIGPEHDAVREYYERTRAPERVRVAFAIQPQARGTADAVLSAESFVQDAPFLVVNADNYYPVEVLRVLTALDGPGLPAFGRSTLIEQSNIDEERIRSFALLTVDDTGTLVDIIEKPDPATFARYVQDPREAMDGMHGRHGIQDMHDVRVSMNCWRFGPSIFTACRSIEISPRGELELPNAVRYAIRVMGERFRAIPVDAGVLDLSRREDIVEVERRLSAIEPRP